MLSEEVRLFRDQRRKPVQREEAHLVDFSAQTWHASWCSTAHPDVYALWPGSATNLDDPQDLGVETGLFLYLANDRIARGFARFHESAWEPPWVERPVRVSEEQHPSIAVENDPEDADDESRLAHVDQNPLQAGREMPGDAVGRALDRTHHAVAAAFPSATFS